MTALSRAPPTTPRLTRMFGCYRRTEAFWPTLAPLYGSWMKPIAGTIEPGLPFILNRLSRTCQIQAYGSYACSILRRWALPMNRGLPIGQNLNRGGPRSADAQTSAVLRENLRVPPWLILGRFRFTEQFKTEQVDSHEPFEDELPTFNIERSTSKDTRFSNSTFGVGRSMF